MIIKLIFLKDEEKFNYVVDGAKCFNDIELDRKQ